MFWTRLDKMCSAMGSWRKSQLTLSCHQSSRSIWSSRSRLTITCGKSTMPFRSWCGGLTSPLFLVVCLPGVCVYVCVLVWVWYFKRNHICNLKYADYLLLCRVYYSCNINPLKGYVCLLNFVIERLLVLCWINHHYRFADLLPATNAGVGWGVKVVQIYFFDVMFFSRSFSGSCIFVWGGRGDWLCC